MMADFGALPKNWREKAEILPSPAAEHFRFLGEGVWTDDFCPRQLSIIVIDKDLKVFRLTDSADTLSTLRALNFSPIISE